MSTYNNSSLTYDAGTTSYDGAPGAIAGLPQATIEIAFDDGPYVWEPYWTDVTRYVRSVNVRRGRNDDLSPFVGTASVELDNRDRRFDPFNTSGVYYGKLLPRRQIRIRAAAGANTYDVFRGYVAGWPTSYTEAGFDATVTLDCFDALAFVASEDTPDTWLSDYTLSLNPYRYLKFNEPTIAQYRSSTGTLNTTFKDYGSQPRNISTGSGQVSAGGAMASGLSNSLDLSSGTLREDALSVPAVTTFTALSASVWVRLLTSTLSTGILIEDGGFDINIFTNRASYTTTPFLGFSIRRSSTGVTYNYTTDILLSDDFQFHVACTFDVSTLTFRAYVNGSEISVTGTTGAAGIPAVRYIEASRMMMSQVATFDYVLTPSQVALLYRYGSLDISEQVPSRLTRIFRTTPFPEITSPSTDFRVWEAPLATQFIQGLNNDNPLNNELASLSASEGGELFCARDGVIYLTGRDTQNYSSPFLPYEPCIVQATFSDAAGTALPYGPTLDVEWDADGIINDLSLTFTGGGNVTASDATSISANGKRSQTISTQLTGPTGAGSPQDLADLRVEYFRHVIPRVSPLDVGMTRDLTDWQTLLALELMDAFAVQRTPSVGSALDFRLQVQNIEHQIVPGDWRMRVTGSARYANWFTADVDSADGARLAV